MLEQRSLSLITSIITDFHNFNSRQDNLKLIKEEVQYLSGLFVYSWKNLSKSSVDERSEIFPKRVCQLIGKVLPNRPEYVILESYVQYAFNVLSVIDENKYLVSSNYKALFLCQLDRHELLLLYFFTFDSFDIPGMPYYDNLQWKNSITTELLRSMKKEDTHSTDYSQINLNKAVSEFQKLQYQSVN